MGHPQIGPQAIPASTAELFLKGQVIERTLRPHFWLDHSITAELAPTWWIGLVCSACQLVAGVLYCVPGHLLCTGCFSVIIPTAAETPLPIVKWATICGGGQSGQRHSYPNGKECNHEPTTVSSAATKLVSITGRYEI